MIFSLNSFLVVMVQGEMQQLRDKLAIAERTAKTQQQLKVFCHSFVFLINIFNLICFCRSFSLMVMQQSMSSYIMKFGFLAGKITIKAKSYRGRLESSIKWFYLQGI